MEITLRNQMIPYKESNQFLGIAIKSRLNWEVHIDRVRARANAKRAFYTIHLVAGKRCSGDQNL